MKTSNPMHVPILSEEIAAGRNPEILFNWTIPRVDAISLIPGVQKKKVFNLLDEVQSSMGIDILNDYIIQDSELITYRIERVLDKSIKEYEENDV